MGVRAHSWAHTKPLADNSLWTSVRWLAHYTFHCFLSSVPNSVFSYSHCRGLRSILAHHLWRRGDCGIWELWDGSGEWEHALWGCLRFVLVWIKKHQLQVKLPTAGTILRRPPRCLVAEQTYSGFLPLREKTMTDFGTDIRCRCGCVHYILYITASDYT